MVTPNSIHTLGSALVPSSLGGDPPPRERRGGSENKDMLPLPGELHRRVIAVTGPVGIRLVLSSCMRPGVSEGAYPGLFLRQVSETAGREGTSATMGPPHALSHLGCCRVRKIRHPAPIQMLYEEGHPAPLEVCVGCLLGVFLRVYRGVVEDAFPFLLPREAEACD